MTSRNYLLKSLKGNIRRNFWLMILFFLAFLAAMPVSTLTALDGARHIYGISQVYLRNTFINCNPYTHYRRMTYPPGWDFFLFHFCAFPCALCILCAFNLLYVEKTLLTQC